MRMKLRQVGSLQVPLINNGEKPEWESVQGIKTQTGKI